jgi:hypothetical protein
MADSLVVVRTTEWKVDGSSETRLFLVAATAVEELRSYLSGRPLDCLGPSVRDGLTQIVQRPRMSLIEHDDQSARQLHVVLWINEHGTVYRPDAEFEASIF